MLSTVYNKLSFIFYSLKKSLGGVLSFAHQILLAWLSWLGER